MTGKLTETQGDALAGALLFRQNEKRSVIVPHVCNDIGAWGSGFVVAINNAYGYGPRTAYEMWHQHGGNYTPEAVRDLREAEQTYNVKTRTFGNFALGKVQFVSCLGVGVTVANMIGQHETRRQASSRPPIRYGALATAMQTVQKNILWNADRPAIHCPRFGSELAGGEWKVIHEMIQEIWIDAGIDVTIYEFV